MLNENHNTASSNALFKILRFLSRFLVEWWVQSADLYHQLWLEVIFYPFGGCLLSFMVVALSNVVSFLWLLHPYQTRKRFSQGPSIVHPSRCTRFAIKTKSRTLGWDTYMSFKGERRKCPKTNHFPFIANWYSLDRKGIEDENTEFPMWERIIISIQSILHIYIISFCSIFSVFFLFSFTHGLSLYHPMKPIAANVSFASQERLLRVMRNTV